MFAGEHFQFIDRCGKVADVELVANPRRRGACWSPVSADDGAIERLSQSSRKSEARYPNRPGESWMRTRTWSDPDTKRKFAVVSSTNAGSW
jgi:hypothetical protein